jgi:hypothetical protein
MTTDSRSSTGSLPVLALLLLCSRMPLAAGAGIDCTYAPCVKDMIEHKRQMKSVYERLADKHAKFSRWLTMGRGRRWRRSTPSTWPRTRKAVPLAFWMS